MTSILEEKIINESIAEIKQIIGILNTQISSIDSKRKSNNIKPDPVDELVRIKVLDTKKSYLEYYKKVVEFIHKKLEDKEPDESFFFFIPLLRILMEIYSYLLYLCSQDENRQMTVIAYNTLRTIYQACLNIKSKDFICQYEIFEPFITKGNLSFKENYPKSSPYNFPLTEEMFKTTNIKLYSPQISAFIDDETHSPYYIYGLLSNYVHGNYLTKDHYGNEKFWLISQTLLQSVRVVELISIRVLDGAQRASIKTVIERIKKNYPSLKEIWENRSKNIDSSRKSQFS